MEIKEIEEKAAVLRQELGGNIFGFPINEDDPHSKYAVAMYNGEKIVAFPTALNITEAAAGILEILNSLKDEGLDADYTRNVRLISYSAQINAPNVTMRRLKKENRTKGLEEGVDVHKTDDGYNFSARGIIKFSYYSMIDEKLPKAIEFMNKYYQLLSMKRYGKTAAAIKQEVKRMTKDETTTWIETTYKKYISDDFEVFELMNLK